MPTTRESRGSDQPEAEPIRRTPGERAAAWLVTGPAGHLYSIAADLAVFLGRTAAARVARAAGRQRRA